MHTEKHGSEQDAPTVPLRLFHICIHPRLSVALNLVLELSAREGIKGETLA
jgi:hypothetical protein